MSLQMKLRRLQTTVDLALLQRKPLTLFSVDGKMLFGE
jgi:hypothetical protein